MAGNKKMGKKMGKTVASGKTGKDSKKGKKAPY